LYEIKVGGQKGGY